MQPNEEKIYAATGNFRTHLFRPLTKLLSSIGIAADTISYLGAALMIGFIFSLPDHKVLAFWLLFGRMIADIIDGPLARFQKTDSDRGKFVDVTMDNLSFALFIFGVLKAGFVHPLPAAVFLFATELVVVLMIIRYNIKHKSRDWYFYASAGGFPYALVYGAYLLFSIYAFSGHNWLNGAAEIFSVLLIYKAAKDYSVIQATKKR